MSALAKALKKSAKADTTKKKTSSTMPIIVGDETQTAAVAQVRKALDTIKKQEAILDEYGSIVREFFEETQKADGHAGKFRKSYKFSGDNDTEVKVVRPCRSLKINYGDLESIQEILTEAEFDLLFEEKSVTKLRKEVFDDDDLTNELLARMGDTDEEQADNLAKFFETTESLTIKKDYDKNIFNLTKKAFHALGVYVKLIKPGIQ